jgi:xylose isomerase
MTNSDYQPKPEHKFTFGRFNESNEIQSLLAEIRSTNDDSANRNGPYTRARAESIKTMPVDRAELAAKKLPYERIDQLTVDILFGVR